MMIKIRKYRGISVNHAIAGGWVSDEAAEKNKREEHKREEQRREELASAAAAAAVAVRRAFPCLKAVHFG